VICLPLRGAELPFSQTLFFFLDHSHLSLRNYQVRSRKEKGPPLQNAEEGLQWPHPNLKCFSLERIAENPGGRVSPSIRLMSFGKPPQNGRFSLHSDILPSFEKVRISGLPHSLRRFSEFGPSLSPPPPKRPLPETAHLFSFPQILSFYEFLNLFISSRLSSGVPRF